MNDREKEVYQAQLDAEKAVLKKLEKLYQSALDDIDEKIKLLQSDELTQSKIYQAEYQKALRGQIAGIVEKLHGDEYTTIQQYLHDCYTDAFVGTMYDIHGQGIPLILPIDQNAAVKAIQLDSKINEGLYKALGVDATALKKTIQTEVSRGIATSLGYSAIARNISNASKAPRARAMLIARTESHRITQASTFDAQKGAKKRGCDVLKQWDATLDGDTRSTHRQLDGQLREIDKPFELGNKKAMFPGDFGDPAEDCNCRCVSNTRAKWDLDEDELETLKERARFFGLMEDDSKAFGHAKEKTTFASFKKVYQKSMDYGVVQAGKIEANGIFVNKSEALFRYAKNIAPIDGYEDFTCHADPDNFLIGLADSDKDESVFVMTPEEYAEAIKKSSSYKGGNVRIISCQAGAKPDGAAQRLADALGVDVYAPTEIVNVAENGEMFVSDNDILADLWYNADDRSKIKETGKWIVFHPQKG